MDRAERGAALGPDGGPVTRALVVEPGAVALLERADPELGPGELLVAPRLVGLCGTDLELVAGQVDPAYVAYPLVIGHEWTGVVVASATEDFAPGDRVVVEGIVPCRHCGPCAAGDTNLCETYDEFGFNRDGAATDLLAVPGWLAHHLADGVAPEDAVLVEPASVVYRALVRALRRPGLSTAVVGDGTVALLVAHLLQLWSPAATTVLGQREAQRGLATAAGATDFTTSDGDGRYDLVVEAAGTVAAVERALRACRRGGTVVLLGLPPAGSLAAVAPDDLVNNDVTVVASFAYTRSAWRQVVELLNAGRLRPSFLVTHRFAFDDHERAFSVLRSTPPGEPRGKVLLEVGPAA